MKVRHASSEESAAAFRESYNRRRAQAAAKRQKPAPPLREGRRPAPRREAKRVATPSAIGPDTLFVRISLPISTYNELLDHCAEFEISPQAFIKQMVRQAKLSRSGT